MPKRNVHLTEHFDSLIASGIKSGQFSNASEAVREGLRLLEQRQQEDKARGLSGCVANFRRASTRSTAAKGSS